MYRILIEFDEERMKRDGIDIDEAWEQIEQFKEETEDITESSKGCFEAADFGSMAVMQDMLEDEEWIMKYVCRWMLDFDRGKFEDIIEDIRESGRKCCYE